MADVFTDAEGWTHEVDDGSSGFYAAAASINEITSFGLSRAYVNTDQTAMGDGGKQKHRQSALKWTYTLEGKFVEDSGTGVRAVFQERMEVLGSGPHAAVPMRLTSPGGKVYTFNATIELGDQGGGLTEDVSWSATCPISGDVTRT